MSPAEGGGLGPGGCDGGGRPQRKEYVRRRRALAEEVAMAEGAGAGQGRDMFVFAGRGDEVMNFSDFVY